MSDEAPEKSGKTWLYVTGILVSLPLLYVLSVGPVAVLMALKVIPESGYRAFIGPLAWFVKQVGTDFGIEAYAKLWFQMTGTPWPW